MGTASTGTPATDSVNCSGEMIRIGTFLIVLIFLTGYIDEYRISSIIKTKAGTLESMKVNIFV